MKSSILLLASFLIIFLSGCKTPSLGEIIEEKYSTFPKNNRNFLTKEEWDQKRQKEIFRYQYIMQEPSLSDLKESDYEAYRIIFFSAFHMPGTCISFSKSESEPASLTLKCLSSSSRIYPGHLLVDETKYLSTKEWNRLMSNVCEFDFWEAPFLGVEAGINEGAYYTMEGYKNGKYHVISRGTFFTNPDFFNFYFKIVKQIGLFKKFNSPPCRKFAKNEKALFNYLDKVKNPQWGELEPLLKATYPADSGGGWYIFSRAVRENKTELVNGFLSSLTDEQKQGSLCYRILSSNTNYHSIKAFLEHGFDPNLTANRVGKWSPEIPFNFCVYNSILNKAIKLRCIDSVKLLLQYKADPNFSIPKYVKPPLISAAVTNKDIVKALVDAGADLNCVDDDGNTPLMLASAQHKVEIVKFLLKQGANPNTKNKYGYTALMLAEKPEVIAAFKAFQDEIIPIPEVAIIRAIQADDLAGFERLLEKYAGEMPECIILECLKKGKIAFLEKLLDSKNRFKNTYYSNFIYIVWYRSDLAMVEVLLRKGVDAGVVSQQMVYDNLWERNIHDLKLVQLFVSKIHQADLFKKALNYVFDEALPKYYHISFSLSKKLIDFVISQKPDFLATRTLSVWDCKDNFKTLKYLAEKRAQFEWNCLNRSRENFLFYLIENHAPIEDIKYLVNKGVDINHRSKFNSVPLLTAYSRFNQSGCYDKKGNPLPQYSPADLKFFDELKALEARIPDDLKLAAAFIRDDYKEFDKLLSAGANPNIMVGDRPLIDEAISIGATPGSGYYVPENLQFFYRMLQEPEIDVNIFDLYFGAPIHWVIDSRLPDNIKLKITRMLLDKGADVNSRHIDTGNTPLISLVWSDGSYEEEQVKFVKLFLKYGANPNLANDEYLTPLDYAKDPEVLNFLKSALKKQQQEKK